MNADKTKTVNHEDTKSTKTYPQITPMNADKTKTGTSGVGTTDEHR